MRERKREKEIREEEKGGGQTRKTKEMEFKEQNKEIIMVGGI